MAPELIFGSGAGAMRQMNACHLPGDPRMRLRNLYLLIGLTCACSGEATLPPAPTPHGDVAHYDHLPTPTDIAAVEAAGGTNIVTIRLANCLWFQTVVGTAVFDSLPGVIAQRLDSASTVEPVYVSYASAATPSDSALLDSLSSAPRSTSFFSDSVLISTIRMGAIDQLARDKNVHSVYITHFEYPIF